MKPGFAAALPLIALVFLTADCGYRFTDPFPASRYTLAKVRNATAEPGLARSLADALLDRGGFVEGSDSLVYATVTGFAEGAASVRSGGTPLRQELSLTVAWRVERRGREALFGDVTVSETYPYSGDAASLQWNRAAAVRLLVRSAAGKVLDRLAGISP